MSKSTVTVSSATSKLHLAGYNARLSTYDAYELNIAHRYCAQTSLFLIYVQVSHMCVNFLTFPTEEK